MKNKTFIFLFLITITLLLCIQFIQAPIGKAVGAKPINVTINNTIDPPIDPVDPPIDPVIPTNAIIVLEDFEDSLWTAGGTGQGMFEIGNPSSFTTSGECTTTCLGTGISDDHTTGGTKAACTNLNGHLRQFEDSTTNFLISPVYDFSGKQNLKLELWKFMEIEGDNYDYCYFQYKNSASGS